MTLLLPDKRYLSSDVSFLLLTGLTWFSFFVLTEGSTHYTPEIFVLFTIGSGFFSFLTLKILGYFDPLRLVPRKSDLFLVMFAIPLGGFIQHEIFRYVFRLPVWPVLNILLYTPILALIIFGVHFVFARLQLKRGKKKKIVLELLPEEHATLLRDFESYGIAHCIEFLTIRDLKKHLLEAKASEIDLIVISRDTAKQFDIDATLLRAHLAGIPVVDHRTVMMDLTGRICLTDTDLWTYVMSATPQTALLRTFSHLKIICEPVIAVALGIVLLPVFLVIASLIKLTSKGPIFYKQIRTGYLGKTFTLIKFRSMFTDSEINGPQWCTDNDCRITPLGKFLRKTRLDEFPQLLNVLKGEMSFFGPRPERPEIYNELKKEIPLFSLRTIVRPGITGWAQVCAGYAASVQESRLKLEYDLYYIQHMSPRLDLIILVKTLEVALFGSKRLPVPKVVDVSVSAPAVASN
jgi:lipopolysaccharide/colanic/teichoic acid biosynthesis glycosyltransferase